MKNHSFITNDKGLTPVIGEILLIAVVVIIASVIGSYVYGMGGDFNEFYIVGTNAQQIDSDTIKITYINSNEPDLLMYLNVSVNGYYYANGNWNLDRLNTFNGNGTTPIEPGTVVYIHDNTSTNEHITSSRNYVLIVAGFVDGSKQVVLDTSV